jgi:fimbrial chaperone protein
MLNTPPSNTLHRRLRFAIALAACLAPAASHAGSYGGISVTPIPITLSPTQTSVLMQVSNGTSENTSFQIQTYQWSQSPDNQMELTPSDNIVAFPSVFSLSAEQTRDIRVAVLQPRGMGEDTYRIIVRQLPSPAVVGTAQVDVLAAFNLPVYLTVPGAAAAPAVTAPVIEHGRLVFAVANAGNAHMKLGKVIVTGFAGSGGRKFQASSKPIYILAGGRVAYAVDLAPRDCARTSEIQIVATLLEPERTIISNIPVSPASCAGAGAARTAFEGDTAQDVVMGPTPANIGQ